MKSFLILFFFFFCYEELQPIETESLAWVPRFVSLGSEAAEKQEWSGERNATGGGDGLWKAKWGGTWGCVRRSLNC